MREAHIEIHESGLSIGRAERLLAGIPGGSRQAVASALNRAVMAGRTTAVRETTAQYTLRAKDIRPTIRLERSSASNMEASISSTGRRVPLSAYVYKPKTDTTGSRRRQVYVSVKKGGEKPLGQGFIWNGNVMQRVGKSRNQITRRTGPAVPVLLNNDAVIEKVMQTMQETTDRRLDHEVSRLLNKNSGGA